MLICTIGDGCLGEYVPYSLFSKLGDVAAKWLVPRINVFPH